ncbi:MAG: HD domain-containing protein [Desulfurococcaceae archaeon]
MTWFNSEEISSASIISFSGQVRDPIYGYIDYLKGLEDLVMDSWPLQRLRYIYQLQAGHFVYPGATHTRFSHSLGVMYSSYKYISFLLRSLQASNLPEEVIGQARRNYREITLATRLLGLLHDIGHGPLSHAFDKHVYRTRWFLGYRIGNHEVMGYLIYRDYIRNLIRGITTANKKYLNIDVDCLLELLDAGMKPPLGMKGYSDLTERGVIKEGEFYWSGGSGLEHIIRMVVRDYIYTSDIMDYLKRDSYFTGVPIGQINDDWIIRNSFIFEKDGRLTIAVASKALDEVSRLFDARRLMYKFIYLHPVNVAFIETLGYLLRCIKSYVVNALDGVFGQAGDYEKYINLTDYSFYTKLQELLFASAQSYECEDYLFANTALKSIFYRRKPVWKLLKRFTYDLDDVKVLFCEIGEHVQELIKRRVKSEVSAIFSNKGISDVDINVTIDRVEAYPTAGAEIVNKIEIVDIKEGRVVYENTMTFEEFAKEHGILSEALITVYLNREKYKSLNNKDIEDIIGIVKEIADSSIKGRRRDAPETS